MRSLYLAYLGATLALVITPGATTAVVVRNTLRLGQRAGVMAALGAAAANATHATLAGLGLWVLVGRIPALLEAMRVAGAAYLAWLGLQSLMRLRSGPDATLSADRVASPSSAATTRTGFREGLSVNLLNPAIISFYLAVVPTFVPASPPRLYFVLLATTHVVLAFICHAGWAAAFHALRALFTHRAVYVSFQVMTALALLWLAARVLGRL